MSDFDRIDAALSVLAGLLATGGLMLYPHFWIALAIFAPFCCGAVARHLDWKRQPPSEDAQRRHGRAISRGS